jgi:hypothetical protein
VTDKKRPRSRCQSGRGQRRGLDTHSKTTTARPWLECHRHRASSRGCHCPACSWFGEVFVTSRRLAGMRRAALRGPRRGDR